MNPRPESQLRDFLAERLTMVESGLTLERAEYPLPSAFGARGRVDLLARDPDGVLVVIEIKRSESSARQAIHELIKYTGLIMSEHGLGPADVRCLLVSTSWRELLVPFSQYVRFSPYEIRGLALELDGDGWPARFTPVSEVTLEALSCCPHSQYFLYLHPDRREGDVPRIEHALARLGVIDYFCVVEDHDGSDDRIMFPFALRLFIGALDQRSKANISDLAPELVDEDYPEWGHELAVFGIVLSASRRDSFDSGTPQQALQEAEHWSIRQIRRGGRFTSSLAWPEERLTSLARGYGYAQVRRFTSDARPARKGRWQQLRSDTELVLAGIPSWGASFEWLFGAAERNPDDLVHCHIYLPQDLGLTFWHLATGSVLGTPMFRFSQGEGTPRERHQFGAVVWNGQPPPSTLERALLAACRGIDGYLVLRQMDELWTADAELMRLHGFAYETVDRDPRTGQMVVVDPATGRTNEFDPLGQPLLLNDFVRQHSLYVAKARNLLDSFIQR